MSNTIFHAYQMSTVDSDAGNFITKKTKYETNSNNEKLQCDTLQVFHLSIESLFNKEF